MREDREVNMQAYGDGVQAYRDGKRSECPYPKRNDTNRVDWYNGYYDQRHRTILKAFAND